MVIHSTVRSSCHTVLGTHDIPREPNGMAYIKQDGIHKSVRHTYQDVCHEIQYV